MGELIPAWSFGATNIVPADGYGDGLESAVDGGKYIIAAPYISVAEVPANQPDGLCIEKTKKGFPCRGRKIQDTDYCFSHLRKHSGPTAHQGLRS